MEYNGFFRCSNWVSLWFQWSKPKHIPFMECHLKAIASILLPHVSFVKTLHISCFLAVYCLMCMKFVYIPVISYMLSCNRMHTLHLVSCLGFYKNTMKPFIAMQRDWIDYHHGNVVAIPTLWRKSHGNPFFIASHRNSRWVCGMFRARY